MLREYVRYYNEDRPHMALDRDAPLPRAVEPTPQVASLHFGASAAPVIATRGPDDEYCATTAAQTTLAGPSTR
jgi:hypothetical protein